MKTVTNYYTFFEAIILESIDLSDRDNITAGTNYEKIQAVYAVFLDEYGHEVARYKGNEKRAFTEWLMGLPSILTVPFYYHEQLNRAYIHGLLPANANEKEEDIFCQSWFKNCTDAFFTLYDNL